MRLAEPDGVRNESKTLQTLQLLEFPFAVPEMICLVRDDSGETIGLIESAVAGLPLNFLSRGFNAESQLETIAQVASAVHRLPKSKFTHLVQRSDSRTHVLEELNVLPASLFEEFREAAMAREWILCNLAEARTSTVLHGDLLSQNLLFAIPDDHEIAVLDWECAQIGDAAYDLAIVTRGVRRPLGVANGLQRLVSFYNEAAEQEIPPSAVVVHELLLHLHWLAESQTENRRTRPRALCQSPRSELSLWTQIKVKRRVKGSDRKPFKKNLNRGIATVRSRTKRALC